MHAGYRASQNLRAAGYGVGILKGRRHPDWVQSLEDGVREFYLALGGMEADLFPVSQDEGESLVDAAESALQNPQINALLVLDVVLQSDIPGADDFVLDEALSFTRLSLRSRKIITTGTICAATPSEVEERIGGNAGHKGKEALSAALEVLSVQRQFAELAQRRPPEVLYLGSQWHAPYVAQLIAQARANQSHSKNALEIFAGGSLELPFLAHEAVKVLNLAEVHCFGIVLQGKTNHAEVIQEAVSSEILRLNEESSSKVCNHVHRFTSYQEVEHFLQGSNNP